MKITVIGATGGTGHLVLEQALARGYEVTAFARNPQTLPQHTNLTVIKGSLSDTVALSRAMAGSDAVLCCLGVHEKKNVTVMQSNLPHIIEAMQQIGLNRLVLLSAYGVGESMATANFLAKLAYKTIVKEVYADKEQAEKLLPASGLQWTKIYPVILTDQPLSNQTETRLLKNIHQVNGLSKVPRANVAKLMLDCIQDTDTYQETVVLAASGMFR